MMASVRFLKDGDLSEAGTELVPLTPSDSLEPPDFLKPTEIEPRVGHEFQAEIPPFVGASSYFSYPENKSRLLIGTVKPSSDSENLVKDSKEHWSKSERDAFLLGLYIFEKNFVEVRRFVGTKEMGSILSFYYGKFYGSLEYRRWSESRKAKHKKCVYGHKLFSEPRQHELLSRILPGVSQECQNALYEVSKTFRDEKSSLTDYVFSLKSMVGIEALVKAVSIGSGKNDLTGIESSRSLHAGPARPEIPSGKECSSLTTSEIINFLGGGYRLSKARSNDLFWEAVWPRLLARGWHSEQPDDHSYFSGSSHCLVFLVPGVKKFSRRKLVKGDHYFDSVSDVLSRVAKEPGLIELDGDGDEGDNNGGTRGDIQTSDEPARKQHEYLQPRTNSTPRKSSSVMRVTVVDTSLPGGKVRELRFLPSEFSCDFIDKGCVDNGDRGGEEEDAEESETVDNGSLSTAKSDENLSGDIKNVGTNESPGEFQLSRPDLSLPVASEPKKKKKKKQKGKQVKKCSNTASNRKLKKGCKTLTTPTKEVTDNGMLSSRAAPVFENGRPDSCSSVRVITENPSSLAALSQDLLSSTATDITSVSDQDEKPKIQTLFDLNLPQVSPEPEKAVSNKEEPLAPTVTAPPDLNTRRHSTRNRPPTAKALEALADGYLTVTKKRKGKETEAAAKPRTFKRARFVVGSASANGPEVSQVAETEKVSSNAGSS